MRSMSAVRVSSSEASGWSSAQVAPSATSRRLCGGMFVAMPDRDAGTAVDQQVRDAAREDRRLLGAAVVVVDEVDGLLVDVGEHRHRERREPALRVPHRGGGVVARRAEVALPVDQRVAHRPGLGEPHEGVVDRRVAVRVVVAHDVADDAGALHVAAVRAEPGVVHRVEDPAVHRLEAVLHQGECAPHDHAHRVVDVGALHLLLDVDRLDPVAGTRRQRRLGHAVSTPLLGAPGAAAGHRVDRIRGVPVPPDRRRSRGHRARPLDSTGAPDDHGGSPAGVRAGQVRCGPRCDPGG